MKRTHGFLVLSLSAVLGLLAPAGALAMSTYFAAQCQTCHGTSATTCNGCHHHRGTVTGSLAKTTFAPLESVAVSVSAGARTGFWRAAVLDQANKVLGTATPTAAGAVTVTVAAPSAPGSYTWKFAWYGNAYTETPSAASWVADAGNPGHGYLASALPSFTVQSAPPASAPVAGLSPTTLALGVVTVGQTSTASASVSNTGTADLQVGAATPCSGANATSLTIAPAGAFTVAPGATTRLTVSFAPTAAGAASACWSVSTNDPAHATLQLTASGSGADQPPPTTTCTTCHAIPPASGKHSAHTAEGCGTCHGAGYSSTTVVAGTHRNGTVDLASTAGWNSATTSCANACHTTRSWGTAPPPPTQACNTCHGVPPSTGAHAKHASQSCGSCHGTGYTSTTVVAATHQDKNVTMGSGAGWNATAKSCANSCHGSRSWGGGSSSACNSCHAMPPSSGRHALHRSEHVSCAACHGSGYSTTTVNATTHRNGSVNLTPAVRWNATSRSCANACHEPERWGGSAPVPGPTTGCTSCHNIPPASGQHARHQSKRIGCGSCHGAGYSSSTVNQATHRNGKVNLSFRVGFSTRRRTCSNACHHSKSWTASHGGGDDHEEDDFVVAADEAGTVDESDTAGGCSSAGGALSVLGVLGVALAGLRRRRSR